MKGFVCTILLVGLFANINARPTEEDREVIDTQNVYFHTTLRSTTGYVRQNQQIKMDTVVTNVGQAYNQHTGVFTVPYVGYYYFYAQFTTPWTANRGGELLVMANGARKISMIAENPKNNRHVQTSGSAIIPCRKGDRVYLQVWHRGNNFKVHGNNFSNFGGYRLPLNK
eukprot:GHVR01186434.1.p1 GENE.GHVR01186434.1~~GHVR01186434.1.p1  ORF type:complete len:169 (-),score=3.59 GHVR01186434.1:426-932(-)